MNKIYIMKDYSIINDKSIHTGYFAKHDEKSTRYGGWSGGFIGKGNQTRTWKTLEGVKKALANEYPECKVIVKKN